MPVTVRRKRTAQRAATVRLDSLKLGAARFEPQTLPQGGTMLRLVVLAACAAAVRAACEAEDLEVTKPEMGSTIWLRDGLADDLGPVTVKWEVTNDDCDFATVQLQLCPYMEDDGCGDFILDPEDQTGGVNYFFTCNDEKSEDGEPWECVGKAEIVIEDLLDCGSPPCTGLHNFRVCEMGSSTICADSGVFTLQLPGGTWFPTMSPAPSLVPSPAPSETPTSEPSPSPTTAAPSVVPTSSPAPAPTPRPTPSPTVTPGNPTASPVPAPTPRPTSPIPRPTLGALGGSDGAKTRSITFYTLVAAAALCLVF